MSRVRYYLAQSLDGYIAEPDGAIEWLEGYEGVGDAAGAVPIDGTYEDFLSGIGALAMGSATYEFILGIESWPYGDMPTWVFSKHELRRRIWRGQHIQERTVESHITRLRTRLTNAGAGPVLINTWGHGWSLTTPN